ncbi:hypothetical protein [Streptomyces sp. NPDC059247]|uniref:hypothetical protein n=1 Tax=Streptomyces sp. NPDC059247 TaxID=3346790 RepID=UPI003686D400
MERGTAPRFLVTYREEELPEGDPRRSVMASLLRQRLAMREELGRLDKKACLAVVRDASDGAPRDDRAHRVWELSLGNPLFALELARGLTDGDGSDDVTPEGVRELVADRLLRIDGDARRVVEALSVAGGDSALTELLDVAEQGLHPPVSGAAADDALERAIAA